MDLQEEIQNAGKAQARQCGHWELQEACLEVLPDEDRALPDRTIPALGKGSPHRPVLVVPVPHANERPPLQGVSGMEDAAKDSVGQR